MASFNKIIIVGYLGRDSELRYTPQGTPVCDFSIATTERRKDKSGEYQDLTTWFRVSFWGKRAESSHQYLTKGKLIYLEGRLNQREYQDRDGNTRTSLDVNCTEVQFIGPRGEEGSGFREERGAQERTSSKPSSAHEDAAEPITDDDIPF
jgi:single-strand DNA-binding protein